MLQETTKVKGYLQSDTIKMPVQAGYGSKFSLLIRILNEYPIEDAKDFSRIVIEVMGEEFDLGPCRVFPESGANGYNARLTCVHDIYDLEYLFKSHKLVTLQSPMANLPLVLGHKTKIKPLFKEYTANLTYDLSVYKSFFDNLDSDYKDEPDHIRQVIQNAILETEGRNLMRALDDRLLEFEELVAGFTKEEHETHGFYFRKQVWDIILSSPFMARTNLKPRGYAGDSEMMRMIYENDYRGDTTFSKILHKHPIEHPAAQAVRNRRKLISRMIRELDEKNSSPAEGPKRILSVACGPAFELNDIIATREDCKNYAFSLLDQDQQALSEARRVISKKEKSLGEKVEAHYLNESVRTLFKSDQLVQKWGRFSIIYSMGLFDYLIPPAAKSLVEKLYNLLEPGGELVVGNYHVSNPGRNYMEYWLDWVLYYRTEDEFKNLLRKDLPADVSVAFEDTGSQMFLTIKKK